MLEALTITTDLDPSLGLLAETMLFYGRIAIMTGPRGLSYILRMFDHALLVDLLKNDWLQLYYSPTQYGIQTSTPQGATAPVHATAGFHSPDHALSLFLPKVLVDIAQNARNAERTAETLGPLIVERGMPHLPSMSEITWSKMLPVVRAAIKELDPEYPNIEDLSFNVYGDEPVTVETNLDLIRIAKTSSDEREHVPGNAIPSVLNRVLGPLQTMRFAAECGTDLLCQRAPQIESEMISRLVVDSDLDPRIGDFQERALGDAKAIRNAIDSGAELRRIHASS